MSGAGVRVTRIQLSEDGLSRMTQQLIEDRTERAATIAGAGYRASVIRTDRPHGMVRTETREAARDNLENNTLLKAVMM